MICTIGLGQHLSGTALVAQVLKVKVAARSAPETGDAEKAVRCVEDVGLTGLEPVTLRLSSACSNQLSYRPTKFSELTI